jgi:hypothetical protein
LTPPAFLRFSRSRVASFPLRRTVVLANLDPYAHHDGLDRGLFRVEEIGFGENVKSSVFFVLNRFLKAFVRFQKRSAPGVVEYNQVLQREGGATS